MAAAPDARTPGDAAPTDFRQRATLGVALIAALLLLPFAVASLVRGQWALTAGTHGILLLLFASALCVHRGRRHQEITLFALVPAGMLFVTQVIEIDPVAGVIWCYPSTLACYCMLDQRRAWAANAVILACSLPAVWLTMDPMLAARITATLLAVGAFAAILVRVIDTQQDRLRQLIVTDALTGVPNRVPLAAALDAAVLARAEHGVPAALLALDLDHFKAVNDERGHEAGDAVLRTVGALLLHGSGTARRPFRVGGEEFLLVITGTRAGGAEAEAEALCDAFRLHPELVPLGVTVSIGVATLGLDEDRRAWTRRADALMYAAKRAGRDRAVGRLDDAAPASGPVPAPAPTPRDGRALVASTIADP